MRDFLRGPWGDVEEPEEEESVGGYDVAQICKNGHVVASTAGSSPQFRQDFCARCGAETLMACPGCSTPIRGHYEVPGVIDFTMRYRRPAYCFKCGKPFPWTEAALQAARELADLDETLKPDEKEQVKADLEAITTDTPRTKVAATRLGILFKKMGAGTAKAIRDVAVDLASEAAKKILFPGS
jgi:hypothetical protein